jgi:hypothetical protein
VISPMVLPFQPLWRFIVSCANSGLANFVAPWDASPGRSSS